MNTVKKRDGEANNEGSEPARNNTETPSSYLIRPDQPAMDLSLIPPHNGFVPGNNQEFHQQPMHIIADGVSYAEGRSYESRSCTGGWCPVSPEIVRTEITTAAPKETTMNAKDPRRPFRPLHLHTATSRE
ncbi:unnamed protein product [Strongylus vulgaris]|uniref:Uncharacterized protein n=1 Tax=Strongylus vulgaris TaxID=40348 RepID=A0A3P7LPB4_STRVU|nr:unnamed protein product [Strongylus vulgaris]